MTGAYQSSANLWELGQNSGALEADSTYDDCCWMRGSKKIDVDPYADVCIAYRRWRRVS